jgi:hypothetical protein
MIMAYEMEFTEWAGLINRLIFDLGRREINYGVMKEKENKKGNQCWTSKNHTFPLGSSLRLSSGSPSVIGVVSRNDYF